MKENLKMEKGMEKGKYIMLMVIQNIMDNFQIMKEMEQEKNIIIMAILNLKENI